MTASTFRYRVTSVWGSMKKRVNKDDVIIELNFLGNSHAWQIVNTRTGKISGGFKAVYVTPRQDAPDIGYVFTADEGHQIVEISARSAHPVATGPRSKYSRKSHAGYGDRSAISSAID